MKKKIIAFITLIIGILLIVIPKLISNNDNDSKNNLSSLINKELDVTISHEDNDIIINDFTETKELYLFNLTNLSNKKLEFERLKVEFFDENKDLIFTEEFTVTIEKNNIKTFQIRKDYSIQTKVKYIKLKIDDVDTSSKSS